MELTPNGDNNTLPRITAPENTTDNVVTPTKNITESLVESPQKQALDILLKYKCIEQDAIEINDGVLSIKDVWNFRIILWIENIDDIKWLEVWETGKNRESLNNKGLINKVQVQGILVLLETLPEKLLIIPKQWPIDTSKAIYPKQMLLEDIMGMRDGSYRIKNSNPHSDYKDMLTKNWSNLSLSYADKKNAAGYILQA